MPAAVSFSEDSVSGFLHVPSEPINSGLVLTHGAGANCEAPLLKTTAEAFASAGMHVLRMDLAFRKQRRFGPPHPARSAEDRMSLQAAVTALRGIVFGPVFLGGHSYGGRQASMLAAENLAIADALLLLSYPLHPPEKPEQLRTAHFPKLRLPCLFVHGTKDPFATVEEMQASIGLIPGCTELSIVTGAGHDLNRGKFDMDRLLLQSFRRITQHAAPVSVESRLHDQPE